MHERGTLAPKQARTLRRGTFTLTVAWSVCVDFQAGIVLALLFTVLRGVFPASDAAAYKTAGYGSPSSPLTPQVMDHRRLQLVRLAEKASPLSSLTSLTSRQCPTV